MAVDGGFDRVLWLDSDMVFSSDLFKRFHERLDAGYEMVTGLYFSRKLPIRPVIYKDLRLESDGRFVSGVADNCDDYPRDSLFPVKGCGFGAVMTSVDLLRRLRDRFGQPFVPLAGFGEDLSFCLRVADAGVAILCDSGIKLGHVGLTVYSEESFCVQSGHAIT